MMRALPVLPEFHVDETLLSFASRLAAANGYTSLTQFLTHVNLRAERIARGDFATLKVLSALSGRAIEELTARSITPLEPRSLIAGNKLNLVSGITGRNRLCPCCAISDSKLTTIKPVARPYARLHWLVTDIQHCSEHGVRLSVLPDAAHKDVDYVRFVERNSASIQRMSDESTRVPVPAVELYIADRLAGKRTCDLLDDLELHDSIEFCRALGRFLVKRGSPTSDLNIANQGYLAVSGGAAAVETAIANAISLYASTHEFSGAFLSRLDSDLKELVKKPEVFSLRDLLHDIAVRGLPLGPGDAFLKPVERRVLHSKYSAYVEYRISEPRIVEVLTAAGIIKPAQASTATVWFDADAARPHLMALEPGVDDSRGGQLLGVTEAEFKDIRCARLIGNTHQKYLNGYYADNRPHVLDIEELSAKLASKSRMATDDEGMLSIKDAALAAMRRYSFFLTKALEGQLETFVHVEDSTRLTSYRVGLLDVFRFAKNGMSSYWDFNKVRIHLGVDERIVDRLVAGRHLRFIVLRDALGREVKRVIPYEGYKAFSAKYVGVRHMSAVSGLRRSKVHERMFEHGIEPIAEEFYLASDVAKLKNSWQYLQNPRAWQ